MKYYEFEFNYQPKHEVIGDVLMAILGDVGFESFVEEETVLKAYIQQHLLDEEALKESIQNFPLDVESITYHYQEAEDKNWNEEWGKNFFQPIVIGNECVIHSTFHTDVPQAKYDIIINPQMAFGTGHHETTSLVIRELLRLDLTDKALLDMGCGTSILAILAHKRGAKPITAIDIDSWCVENSKENCKLNQIDAIQVKLGDAGLLKNEGPFDLIIANINRNILLQDMEHYSARLSHSGQIVMSGFYTEDIPLLEKRATELGLALKRTNEQNNWACILLEKNA